MKDSLQWFLDKFPFFLDKDSSSNFFKSSTVLNNNFKDLHNDLFKARLGNKLQKRVLIWKEQEDEYDYTIQFFVNVPGLKQVTCYKNDEAIYTQSYNYGDAVNTFVYSYEGTSLKVIPTDTFHIKVETFEEYVLEKGFPENDTIQDNMYDHDSSLDEFGYLYDMPRKTYTYSDNTNLADTEPKYNNRLTEDDYHYMNRLLFYISRLNDTPLPILEVWKLFGIPLEEITMVNREQKLCKMYSRELHGGDDWEPHEWEHKDSMSCFAAEDLFFFVELDNPTPVVGQIINFSFMFLDIFGEEKTTDYLVNVYVNDTLIQTGVNPIHDYVFDTTDVEEEELVFRFEAESDNVLGTLVSDDFIVTLKGCSSADWYVSTEGNDTTGDGSIDYPFKTLPKALGKVEGSRNVIVLCEGEFTITSEQVISTSTSIISCNGATIRNDTTPEFFRVLQGCNLYLQGVALKYRCCTMEDNCGFLNRNVTENPIFIKMKTDLVVEGVNLLCKPSLTFDLDEISDNMYAHSTVIVSGTLLNGETPVSGEEVELLSGTTVLDTDTTDENGEFELSYLVTTTGSHTFVCNHDETEDYCSSTSDNITVTASAMPTSLSATMDSTVTLGSDLNVVYSLEDYYDNPVTTGTVKLMEGTTVLASVTAGETLSYTPPLGSHTYKLMYESSDGSYASDETSTYNVVVSGQSFTFKTGGDFISFYFNTAGAGPTFIDWGDGTSETYTSGILQHHYEGYGTYLVTVTRASLTGLNSNCFAGTNVTEVNLPETVTSLGGQCFRDCYSLSKINLDNITSIGSKCFMGCDSLTSVVIPEGVTQLNELTFAHCTSLASVDIHDGVTSIGSYCFYDCTALVLYELYWTGNDIIAYDSSKMINNTNTVFRVPMGTVSDYVTAGYPSAKLVERTHIIPYPTTLTCSSSKSTIIPSESIVLSGTLVDDESTPVTSASVKLYDGSSLLDTVTTDSAGAYTKTVSGLTSGSHSFKAVYDGDATYDDSESSAVSVFVKTTTSLEIDVPLNLVYSDNFNITGTLADSSNNALSGKTVKLKVDGSVTSTSTTNASGIVSFTHSPVSMGNHTFQLVFEGDSTYASADSQVVTREIGKETSVLTVTSPANNSSIYSDGSLSISGTLLTDDAEAMAGKSVVVSESGTTLTTLTTDSNGAFSGTLSGLTAGTHSIKFEFVSDTYYSGSSVTRTVIVNATTLSVSATADIIQSGDTSTLTATYVGTTVSGKTVVFKKGSTTLDTQTTDVNGQASYTYTGSAAGEVVITVECMSLQETYEVLDCIAYDKGTTSDHNDIWKLNNATLTRGTEYSTILSSAQWTSAQLTGSPSQSTPINLLENNNIVCIEFDAIGTHRSGAQGFNIRWYDGTYHYWGCSDGEGHTKVYISQTEYYVIVDDVVKAHYTNINVPNANLQSVADATNLEVKFANLKIYPVDSIPI